MSKSPPQLPWSFPVAVDQLPAEGQDYHLAADAQTREAVARLAEVNSVPRLQADFHLLPRANGGVHVSGQVWAAVGQTCVVTLEPMETVVDESVDVVFAPEGALAEAPASLPEGVVIESEPPDTLVESKLDLGALATEFLILGIDPYPRKPGAVFAREQEEPAAESPFSALAALKRGAKRS